MNLSKYAAQSLPHIGKWWAGRSRLAQVGYLGAGAYLGALGVSRTLRPLTQRRFRAPPPGRYGDIYRKAPGLIHHQRRKGHHRMGQARSEDHLRQMYGGG